VLAVLPFAFLLIEIYSSRKEVSIMPRIYKPGTDNVPSGKYHEVGPNGGHVDDPHHATIKPGHRLPPTSKPKDKWEKR
jgi:hypothetical protein